MVHVRFEGKSYDVTEATLGLRGGFTDNVLLDSLARYLDIGTSRLQGYVIDRRPSGDVIVHPGAVYG